MLPTGQKPANDTHTDVMPVMATKTIKRGSTNAASAVDASRTNPAISQTARSIYQRSVGTI
jgi:hypothetical protein